VINHAEQVMEIISDRCYGLPVDAQALWSTIERTGSYQDWWPWLRAFDAEALRVGDRWRCVIRSPLPYLVRVTVALREVDRLHLVSAQVSGDIEGTARLTIRERPDGCELRVESSLAPRRPLLRGLASVAPGVARFGHEWVLDTGAGQLAEYLRAGPTGPP